MVRRIARFFNLSDNTISLGLSRSKEVGERIIPKSCCLPGLRSFLQIRLSSSLLRIEPLHTEVFEDTMSKKAKDQLDVERREM